MINSWAFQSDSYTFIIVELADGTFHHGYAS